MCNDVPKERGELVVAQEWQDAHGEDLERRQTPGLRFYM